MCSKIDFINLQFISESDKYSITIQKTIYRRFWTLLRIYGRFFDVFGRFGSELIYSSVFRHFWALQFSIILNSSQIRRLWTLQFRIVLNSSQIRRFWAQQRPKYNRTIRRFWTQIIFKATN